MTLIALGDSARRTVWLGAVASQKVTEARNGILNTVGNRVSSVMVYGYLTVRLTSRTGKKLGHSDPVVPKGRTIAKRIKATLGITGWYCPRVRIDGSVWHLDVDSSYPGAVAGSKGSAVRRLKRYVSWVQTVVRQVGPNLSCPQEDCEELLLVREDRSGDTSDVPVVMPMAPLGSHISNG